MNTLSPSDIAMLHNLERIIERGKETFVEVGLALVEIRERKLYKRDYNTFEAYCQERWGWSGRRSNQLILAAEVAGMLTENGNNCSQIANEAQARELSKAPPEVRPAVLEQAKAAAAADSRTMTAKDIKDAIPSRTATPPPPPARQSAPAAPPPPIPARTEPTDKTGLVIPLELRTAWTEAEGIQTLLSNLSAIRGTVRAAEEKQDPLWAEVNFSSAMSHLDQAYADLKTVKPFAVCPTCGGKLPMRKDCRMCSARGLLSQFRWDNTVPEETKSMRQKVAGK